MYLSNFSQEMTPAEERAKLDIISAEHSKQIHWRESLKLEQKEYESFVKEAKQKEKDEFQEAEKTDQQVRKAKRDLELAQEAINLKGSVKDMASNVAAGENPFHSVVRTLNKFLGMPYFNYVDANEKKKKTFFCTKAFLTSAFCLLWTYEYVFLTLVLDACILPFPVDDNDTIINFMKNDPEFEKRKDSLYLILLGCAAAETPRKFSALFLSTLFTKKYLSTYIWPLGR